MKNNVAGKIGTYVAKFDLRGRSAVPSSARRRVSGWRSTPGGRLARTLVCPIGRPKNWRNFRGYRSIVLQKPPRLNFEASRNSGNIIDRNIPLRSLYGA
jgi:hypothetical protein